MWHTRHWDGIATALAALGERYVEQTRGFAGIIIK